jgi:hypothetical protein
MYGYQGHGSWTLMMHIFFVSGNDLAHAYAADVRTGG